MKKRLIAPLVMLASLLSTQAFLFSTNALADSQPAPEVVIRESKDKTIHEYRINGYLYAIKVFPKNGKPYYLVAEDGGDFSNVGMPGNDNPKILVPRWKVLEW